MALSLRQISELDLPEIQKINDSVQQFPWSPLQIRQEYDQECSFSKVAFDFQSDRLISKPLILGYCFARNVGSDIEITTIGVVSSQQRRGVGKALLLDLVHSKSQNSEVFLEVSEKNRPAVEFYISLGFATMHVRKAYYPDGSDGLSMKLNIAKPQ
ncbi:MAG: N-acetyltransferase [Oligoflexia bacterium]|nr:N-acetyltransferase [Oligoflexia bacterium]